MKFRWGGKIIWRKSKTWCGFHNQWINPKGFICEYTLPIKKKQPWWYVPILYRGVVKKVRKNS